MIASELLTLNTSNAGSTRDAAEAECARHLEVELRDPLDERGARRLEVVDERRLAEDAGRHDDLAGRARRRAVGRIARDAAGHVHRPRADRDSRCSGTPRSGRCPTRPASYPASLKPFLNGMSIAKSSQNARAGVVRGVLRNVGVATGSSGSSGAVQDADRARARCRRRRTPGRPTACATVNSADIDSYCWRRSGSNVSRLRVGRAGGGDASGEHLERCAGQRVVERVRRVVRQRSSSG